jgi:hypothetical protein
LNSADVDRSQGVGRGCEAKAALTSRRVERDIARRIFIVTVRRRQPASKTLV